jgi:hypothetical protein
MSVLETDYLGSIQPYNSSLIGTHFIAPTILI